MRNIFLGLLGIYTFPERKKKNQRQFSAEENNQYNQYIPRITRNVPHAIHLYIFQIINVQYIFRITQNMQLFACVTEWKKIYKDEDNDNKNVLHNIFLELLA